jgi:hypothetical protein
MMRRWTRRVLRVESITFAIVAIAFRWSDDRMFRRRIHRNINNTETTCLSTHNRDIQRKETGAHATYDSIHSCQRHRHPHTPILIISL